MNSVELLEHAAKVLRNMAGGTQDKQPWCPDYTWSAVRHVQRNVEIECGRHGDDPDGECWSFGRYDGRYVALMHPPVALALADWLEATAAELGGPLPSYLDDVDKAAVAVAIAILRKEQT